MAENRSVKEHRMGWGTVKKGEKEWKGIQGNFRWPICYLDRDDGPLGVYICQNPSHFMFAKKLKPFALPNILLIK